MDMVRHDHIATYGDVEVAFGTFAEKDESGMNVLACEKPPSLVRAKSDEIKRTRIKDAT